MLFSVNAMFPKETNRNIVLLLVVPYVFMCLSAMDYSKVFEFDFICFAWRIHLVLCLIYMIIILFSRFNISSAKSA
jgi:hypothetical protein